MEFNKLGKNNNTPSKDLELFPNPGNIDFVQFESNELLSHCPVTNQPDINTIKIKYAPDKHCVESKSLKLYFWSFQDENIFGEGLAQTIVNDIFEKVQPFRIEVSLIQNIRGGIQMSVFASKSRE